MTTLRRLMAILLVTAIRLSVAAQQQLPTLEKGFQPERLYHFGDIDNVNVFNGNLIIKIPIGAAYPVDGALSYQLTLSYNSKIWDLVNTNRGAQAFPSKRSNAGLGWVIGFGRYIARATPENLSNVDLYEAADGGDHRFDGNTPIRLREISTTVREIDLENGTTQKFEKNSNNEWNLISILSPRRHNATGTGSVTINRPPQRPSQCPSADRWWEITDSVRTHYVCFRNRAVDGQARPMVDRVVLAGPEGAQLLYQFTYDLNVHLLKPDEEDYSSTDPSYTGEHYVPMLKSVVLPDLSQYLFSNATSTGARPEIRQVTLPTGSRIAYGYQPYGIPPLEVCSRFGKWTTGVASRVITHATPNGSASSETWGYDFERKQHGPPAEYLSVPCPPRPDDPFPDPLPVALYDEMIVTVTNPLGDKTLNHFSIWTGRGDGDYDDSPAGFRYRDYAYPYGIRDTVQNRYLSQEFKDGSTVQRSVWVRHIRLPDDSDDPLYDPMAPHRLASTRTFFHDDVTTSPGAACQKAEAPQYRCTGTDYDEWDLYNHFRTVKTVGNFGLGGDERTVTTSWNKVDGAQRTIASTDPWIIDIYEDVTGSEPGKASVVEQACFDPLTGFLKAQRKLAGETPQRHDLVTILRMDSTSGNLVKERSFGGDTILLPLGTSQSPLCSVVDLIEAQTPQYEVTHTWQYGIPAKSLYAGASFYATNLTIDPAGVIDTSTDPAGFVTTYDYDTAGRLETIDPPGTQPAISYVYENALVLSNGTLSTPASVKETTPSATTAEGSIQRQYQYDSFGRLWREKGTTADGAWTVREHLFDALGNKKSISEVELLTGAELLFVPTHKTIFTYDNFGRILTATAPDSSVVSNSYKGVRDTLRTHNVATSATVQSAVTTRERMDSQGRLVQVIEDDAGTEEHTTTYSYDAMGRLTGVSMPPQARSFTYDGRGLLLSEQHPESGSTTYTYDAKGHARTRSTALNTLSFDYDVAERLTKVARGTQPLKEFFFDSPNTGAAGRLDHAIRHNYDPDTSADTPVTERYTYAAADGSGRLSKRSTEASGNTFTEEYAYDGLGMLQTITYPGCTGCGLTLPDRTITSRRTNGFLREVSGYTSASDPISYHANGLLHQIHHVSTTSSAGPIYTQLAPTDGMPRPASISVSGYCETLKITTQPVSGEVASGQPAGRTVAADGATSYQWYERTANGDVSLTGQTGTTLTVTITATRRFFVRVSNGTCTDDSDVVTVTVCLAPAAVTIQGPTTAMSRASVALSVDAIAGASYTWSVTSGGGTIVGNGTAATVNVSCATSITVSVDVTTCGGTSTDTHTITVGRPVATISGDQVIRWSESAQIQAAITGLQPWTLLWSPGSSTTVSASPYFRSVTPSATTTYTATASDSCGAFTVQGSARVVVLYPPTLIDAHGISSSQVLVTWTFSGESDSTFVIDRYTPGAGWQLAVGNSPVGSTSYQDNNRPPNTASLYRVRAVKSGVASDPSIADVAVTMLFADDPAIAGTTRVSALHVGQLRAAVDAVRSLANLPPGQYSDPGVLAGVPIRRQHIEDLRTALAQAREQLQNLGLPAMTYSETLTSATPIRATHVNELRGGVR